MGKAANSLWELIISSVSYSLLPFLNHISPLLNRTLAKMHECKVMQNVVQVMLTSSIVFKDFCDSKSLFKVLLFINHVIPCVTVQFKLLVHLSSRCFVYHWIEGKHFMAFFCFRPAFNTLHPRKVFRWILFIPFPPMALAFHFYAQVSICKVRNFKNECQLNASTA